MLKKQEYAVNHQDKMTEIMRMCLAYVAQQNIHTEQKTATEQIEALAEKTFNEIEQFIQEHSNTVVMVRYYNSYEEFTKETLKQG